MGTKVWFLSSSPSQRQAKATSPWSRRPQMARVRAVVNDAMVATAALEVSLLPSPPLIGPPDDGASGRRCGHRPLVDPPFGEGPRGLVP